MKVEIHPKSDYRTSVPIELLIKEVSLKPEVSVENLGEIEVESFQDYYRARFYSQREGKHRLEVKSDNEQWTKDIYIEQQKFLEFGQEFGWFFLGFAVFMTGVVLWVKSAKKA